jgi:hypothetical protein
MEKHREFASNSDYGALLRVFPAALRHSTSPTLEIGIRTEAPKQILGTLDQQRSETPVARLADPELLIDIARLSSPRR